MSTGHSRRIFVTAPYGRLIHEIRLSSKDGRWQARVVTLPNQIWVEPGGRRALVFESDSAEQAEQLAAAFVQKDCVARGHHVANPLQGNEGPGNCEPARRRVGRYPFRFVPRGDMVTEARRKLRAATTGNLSETGLFISTCDPLPPGARVDIDLRLPGLAGRLEGLVVWIRKSPGPGCEIGMGVRLLDPSLAYRALIQTLD